MEYIMFLRGINVGGIKVPMQDLKVSLENIGLDKPKTYLQTGNVRFKSRLLISQLKPTIERALGTDFHYDAFVLILPLSRVKEIIDSYPYEDKPEMHKYVIFCETQQIAEDIVSRFESEINTAEKIRLGAGVIYWIVPKGKTLDTNFAKLIAKPQYKSTITNRNINTLYKIVH